MRNKLEKYISLGSQIKHTHRLTLNQVLGLGCRAQQMAEEMRTRLKAQGWTEGVHDEMVLEADEAQKLKNAMAGRPDWSDAALAALVADVRKHESKCTSDFVTMDFSKIEARCAEYDSPETTLAIMDEVNHAVTPLSRHHMRETCAVTPVHHREAVEVETVKQGDKVFMSGDPTARTVLYAHVSPLFVSFTVISHEDAMPYLIHRHRGALIYKEVK